MRGPAQAPGLVGTTTTTTGSAEKHRKGLKGGGIQGGNATGGVGGVYSSPVTLSPLAVSTVQASLQPMNLLLDGIPGNDVAEAAAAMCFAYCNRHF